MPAPTFSRARPATLRLIFDPDFSSARAVSAAIRGFLAEQRVPEKELFSYELCIAEACYNAIEYAEGAAREFRPVADVLFTRDQVELRVTDHTAGFALPARIPPPSPMNERGRGLFLIQSVMDEVRYLRGPNENTLVMRKRRRAVGPANEADDPPPEAERELEPRRPLAGTAGELSLRSETLSAVFRCCAELGSSSEASEGFSERLLSDLLRLTSADWYLLRLLSPDKRRLLVTASSDPSLAGGPIDLPAPGEAALGAEASAASSRTPARFSFRECPEGSEPLRAVGSGASGLAYPLCFGGSLVGTISLGRRDGEFPIGRLQDELIQTFAEFLAIQTLNLRRRKDEVRNRVVARELEIAQEIQSLLLPRTLPQPAGFGLAGGWHSAREVGGDFYDAIALV
jgi:anti-sigma regulatory factor (Ser/Thr protein kinase)